MKGVEVFGIFGYFRILGSILLLPLSAWFLMLFAGVVATDVGINPFGYGIAIVTTLGIWLAVAPLSGGFGFMRKMMRHKKWANHAGWGPPEFGWRHEGETSSDDN